jgi:predicted transcriptional regulator
VKGAVLAGLAGVLFLAPVAGADGLDAHVGEIADAAGVDTLLKLTGLLPELGGRPTPPEPPRAEPTMYDGASVAWAQEPGLPIAATLGLAMLLAGLLKVLAPLYSRLDRDRILGHPVRRRMLALVADQPGIHLEAAQRGAGIGAGAAAHHVHVLLSSGFLREQRAGRFRRLYPADAQPQQVARDAALRQPRAAALYELVRANPGMGLREAARALAVPASSLQWHCARLSAAGLLERRTDGLHATA